MHGFGAGCLAGFDDPVRDQIALRGRRRSDMHRLVRHLDMNGVAVGIRIDRHGADTHPARCLDDTTGDLAAVGDQNLLEHGCRILR